MCNSSGLKLRGDLRDAADYIFEHSDISREDAERLVKSINSEGACRMAESAAVLTGIAVGLTAGIIILAKLISK